MADDRERTNSCDPQLASPGPQGCGPDRDAANGVRIPLIAARARDLPAIRSLLQAENLPLEGIDESILDGTVVARDAGAIVGSASVERYESTGLLRSVVVTPGERGRDLGRRLVQDRIDWAWSRDLESLALFTETAPRFFARLGFMEVTREELPAVLRGSFEFGFCPSTSTAMILPLHAERQTRIDERYTRAARESCDSLGCGNPTAVATLAPGEIVLDLGSGGGLEVIASAKRVAPGGLAYGVDANDAMLALAERNRSRAGIENARFLKGRIEDLPLPDDHVDVVISNCVVNLSLDKPRAFAEAYRVLRPGGRLAIADIVARRQAPLDIRRRAEESLGCLAGTAETAEIETMLERIGFDAVAVEEVRVYERADFTNLLPDDARVCEGILASAVIRAVKPPRNGDRS